MNKQLTTQVTPGLSSVPWLEEKLTRDYEHSGWVINGQQTMKELNRAYDQIEAQCKPLEDLEIIKALIKLKTLTASRAASNEDYDITLESYTEQLRQYPADSVVAVLGQIAGQSKWFPAWYELKKELAYLSAPRLNALKAIERKILNGRITEIRQGTKGTPKLVCTTPNKANT